MNHARRIQVRAVRRMGELLEAIEPATGQHLPNIKGRGAPTFESRTEVARSAGLSKDQQVQAVRVARVPEHTGARYKSRGIRVKGLRSPVSGHTRIRAGSRKVGRGDLRGSFFSL